MDNAKEIKQLHKVISNTDWSHAKHQFKKGEMFIAHKVFFYNGEHHIKLETASGFKFDAPAVFFDPALTKKMFLNLLLQFIDTDDGDAYDQWFDINDLLKELSDWMHENNED